MRMIFLSLFVLMLSACDNGTEITSNVNGSADATKKLVILASDGREHAFNIELALSPREQEKGLMNRRELAADAGMLFYFGVEKERSFWMKNTLIPLDMIFIRADGTIHHIHENARPNDLSSHPSRGPVAAALELNGGTARKLNIQPGDTVRHPFFQKAKH